MTRRQRRQQEMVSFILAYLPKFRLARDCAIDRYWTDCLNKQYNKDICFFRHGSFQYDFDGVTPLGCPRCDPGV